MTVATRSYTVYRLYDAERNLLYVGCTKNLEERLQVHRRRFPAMSELETEVFTTPEEAAEVEWHQIQTLQPIHNGGHPRFYVEADTGRIDGRKVQQLRLERCITQKQLGIEADVSNETINKIERAREPKGVNLLTAHKIAGALGVDARELLLED